MSMITIQGLNVQDSKLVAKLAKTMALLKSVRARKDAFGSEGQHVPHRRWVPASRCA